ncbi:MAG: hypothetical protein LC795_11760 [Acidobacteria bacterium]|nr:hypothetical protein [Acidobacteriota bacterium]
MGGKFLKASACVALLCVFALAGQASASGQGRGRGGGGGGGRGAGGGPPAGAGVERGIGRSSDSSAGRADVGRGNASDRSEGRSDAGLERARLRRDNARRADEELRAHPSMPARLHTTARDLRDGYQAALAANPNLKFGQYVAATRLAANLGGRHPNVTREAILAGLAGGDSLGRTLRDLGVGPDEAKEAERRVNREIKESKRRS